MSNITVGRSTFRRRVGETPSIVLRNRFFEQNPVLNATEDLTALIARPALKKFMDVGSGPIRFDFSEPGTFSDAAFVVSGTSLYRVDLDGVATYIGEISTNIGGSVSMAATARIGDVPEFLFIADGGVLWLYMEDGAAFGHLEASGLIANADTFSVDGVYYRWTNASVDAGTPAGTMANPWLLRLGIANSEALTAALHAVNGTGDPGTEYSTALMAHPTVTAYSAGANDLYVAARTAGIAGNAFAVTETGANLAWVTGATLTGGGTPQLRQVAVPGDAGAISVDVLNSYVTVIPVQGRGVNGQFYWLEPGETTIDPLNFATAERSPDPINQVVVFGDRAWMLGSKTTEPWITTGNLDAPWQRFSGILYDRGAWQGSAVRVGDSLIVVSEDGEVYQIGGGLKKISRPDIAERIRLAMQTQAHTVL